MAKRLTRVVVMGVVTYAPLVVRAQIPPSDCGSIADLIGSMVLADAGASPEASPETLALTQGGFNARSTTSAASSFESGRRGVLERHRFTAVGPWVRVLAPRRTASDAPVAVAFGAPLVEYYSQRSHTYQRLSVRPILTGALCNAGGENDPGCTEAIVQRDERGVAVVRIPPGQQFAGRWEASSLDVSDVLSLVVSVPVRLHSPINPGEPVRVRTGADYHEDPGSIRAGPSRNAGSSRLLAIQGNWQRASFATVSDVGQQVPGGGPGLQLLIQEPPPCARVRGRWGRG